MKIEVASRIREVKEYYFSTKLREIARRRTAGEDIINLGIGSPDLAPPPKVIDRLRDATADLGSHGYQPYRGISELRTAFSDFYAEKFSVALDPEAEILPLIGSKEGIMHISMAYLEKGDQVLVPNPGYPTYRAASQLAGAEVIDYPLSEDQDWLPNLEKISQSDLSRVKLMWINYPHMPTGAIADVSFFEELVKFAQQHHILICHDNPYTFILNDNPFSALGVAEAKDCIIELISLSKTFNMAGWRVGALVGDRKRLDEVLRFKSNMDSGMFKPLQLAAAEALRLTSDWVDANNLIYQRRRQVGSEILDHLGCQRHAGQVGMFLWGRVGEEYESGVHLSEKLLDQQGVFITPGMIFGSQGVKYVRLSLCSTEETLRLALNRVKTFVTTHQVSS